MNSKNIIVKNKSHFENKGQALASNQKFAFRLFRYFLFSCTLIAISLAIGTIGYKYIGAMSWIDSFYMASMILTGMGPTGDMPSNAAKLFSSFYALYSGVAFLSITAVFFTPIIHRLLHILHVDSNDGEKD
jgi:hypothetical protein